MAMLSSLTGGGGLQGGDTSATGGNAGVTSGTGAKNLNIGGNPNVTSGKLIVPLAIAGAVVVAWIIFRRK